MISVIDIIHYPDIAADVPRKQSLYRDFLTVSGLGFITPLPYPFYIDAKGVARITAVVGGQKIVLKEYEIEFENTIRSASILGARFKRFEIMDRIVEYLTPVIVDHMKCDYAYFRDVTAALRTRDAEAVAKVVREAARPRNACEALKTGLPVEPDAGSPTVSEAK